MDECFHDFWKEVKGLAYAEVPDYDKIRARFAACLEGGDQGEPPISWWDIWEQWKEV
jgi:GH43 family beta-xylosidase